MKAILGLFLVSALVLSTGCANLPIQVGAKSDKSTTQSSDSTNSQEDSFARRFSERKR